MDLVEFLSEWHHDSSTVLVHTSGSTGVPKPLWVEKRRMEASARITCRFLGLQPGDTALLCLPLDYIAGKMMVVRALTYGLRLVSTEPCGKPFWSDAVDFAAMVPMQVWNLLHDAEGCRRLKNIRHLIIGGGAIDDELAKMLKDFPHAVWSTYGMTETLSHIALRRLNGLEASEWYVPFEGVTLSLSADGCLVIDAPRVCRERLVTHDIAEIRPDGSFRIMGRKDNVICSGGLKIQIEEVERQLASVMKEPFMVTKCHDAVLGEAMVLLTEGSTLEAERLCQAALTKHWRPRHYLHIKEMPMTETGKPARALAQEITERMLAQSPSR